MIPMQAVRSSNVDSIGHDGDKTMAVRYKDGGTYHYEGVDKATFDKVHKAKSVGIALHKHVKSRIEGKKQK